MVLNTLLLMVIATIASISHSMVVDTYAGYSIAGYAARVDGVPAAAARLQSPRGIHEGSSGDIFITDADTSSIYLLDANASMLSLFAGGGSNLTDGAAGRDIAMRSPWGITGDGDKIYYSDASWCTLRAISMASGAVTTVAGTRASCGFSDGPAATALFNAPKGIFLFNDTLYIADSMNHRIRAVDLLTASVRTVTGSTKGFADGSLLIALLDTPSDLWIDSNGVLYIADAGNCLIRRANATSLEALGTPSEGICAYAICGDSSTVFIVSNNSVNAVDLASGSFEMVLGGGHLIASAVPSTNLSLTSASACTVSKAGNLFVTDYRVIWQVNDSIASAVAGFVAPLSVPLDHAALDDIHGLWGDNSALYVSEPNNHRVLRVFDHVEVLAGTGVGGYSRDGTATLSALHTPHGVVGDANGNLFIAEYDGNRVRKVASAMLSTVAGNGQCAVGVCSNALTCSLCHPSALAVSGSSLFISDANHIIRRLDLSTGIMSIAVGTGADGYLDNVPPTMAIISQATAMWVDFTGRLFISDANNAVVSMVEFNANMTRHAGIVGVAGYSGEYLPATSGSINAQGICGNGNTLFLTGAYRLQAVQGGVIRTYAGNGIDGTADEFVEAPSSIGPAEHCFADNRGYLYYSESSSAGNRIRRISNLYPTGQPSSGPSGQPTVQPTAQPTSPSAQPSCSPSSQPTRHPSGQPSNQPTGAPSVQPSCQPSSNPTQPSAQPTRQPSGLPTGQPSRQPSRQPSSQPTQPTSQPSRQPVADPSGRPSSQPSCCPSSEPSSQPIGQPTTLPSGQPSASPTVDPSGIPPNITSIRVASSRTQLAVAVQFSSDSGGVVYCAAVNRNLTNASEIIGSGSSAPAISNQSIVLAGLMPSSLYQVYCTAASRSGVWQPWERTLQLMKEANTTCCKVISVELQVSSVYEGSAAVDSLSVSLSHPPSQDLIVHSEFIGTGAVPAIYPNSSVFNNASLSLSSSATVVAGSRGSFLLDVALSGASVREFEISYLNRNLTVLILSSEPTTPQLLNGRFAEDGSFVDLTFDSNTNSAGHSNTFDCSALLSFDDIATSSCQFVSSSVIRIISNKLVIGSAVTLLPNTALTAECISSNISLCTTWQAVAGTVVSIQAPAVPQAPTVIISAPAVITACQNLTLDLSASHGSAGRPWANFTLIASRIGDDAPDADLQSFLNGCAYSPPVNIPAALLAKGVIYAVTGMLCNFLFACSSTTVLVQVTNTMASSPVVSIAGGSIIVLSRNKTLEVKALAYLQGCDGIVTFTGIQYNWTLLSLTGSSMAPYTSQSQDAALFKLPTNTLTAGSSYSLVVTVTSDQSTATARAVVTVSRGNIVAVIDGGQRMLIKTNTTGAISAAHSFDQDLSSSGTAGLAFSWSCVQTAPRFSVDCSQSLLMQGAGETLQVRSSRTNTTSRVTVLVYDSSRSSRAFVDVTVTDADVNAISFLTPPSVLVSVPVNRRLTLSASLTIVSSCIAQWSVQDSTVNLTSTALTALRQSFSIGSGYRFNLAISANNLPERATLLFSLQCGLASAAITVSTNGAPLPGRFSVLPMNGTELLTLFQFSAAEWSDPDLPLTFQFAFYAPEPKAFLVIQGQSQTAYLSSTLPAGPLVSNFTFDCSLEVFDAYNASVVAYQEVRVVQLDSSKQQDALQSILDNAYNLTIDGKKSVLSVASTVINRVNCTLSPDCSALHRDDCVTTDHTCSSCLDGYQGDTGDFNTICIPIIVFASTICAADADCGDLQYCNTTERLCSFLPARCNNDCSGNGECFYSSLSTGVIVSDCKITELTCQAQCRCVDGYSGIGCAMSDAVLESRRALRADIVDLLFDIIQQDDINYNSLISYSSFLETIVKNPYELSLREAFTVRSMITLSVDYGVSLHVDYASLGGILQAADSILSVATAGYSLGDENLTITNNTASRLIEVLGTFLDIIAQDSVSGQENTEYLLSNFRIVNAIYSIGSESNVTLGVPESRAEDVADFSNTGLLINPLSDLATGTTIAANLIQIYEKSFTNDPSSFFSDPIRLKIVSADNTSIHADSLVSIIVFTIRNNDALSYFVFGNATGPSYSTNCSANVTETRYLCPYSNSSIVHICNGTAGVLTSYCPITTPSCNLLNVTSADASTASTCALVNFTQSTTTCSCPVLTSSARRLQVSADGVTKLFDERSLMDLAAASVFVAMDFKNTFNSADELSSAAGARKALAIILFFCTLWAGGFVCVAVIHTRESKLVAKQMLLKGGNGHKQQIQQLVSEYIESIIPAVYNETDSVFVRFFREISLHHRYFHLFVPDTRRVDLFDRFYRTMKILTILTMTMFLQAVLFDFQSPSDDGSCNLWTDEVACLEKRTLLDSDVSYCKWQPEDASPCVYDENAFSQQSLLYVIIIVTVCTDIFKLPVDMLLVYWICPVYDDQKPGHAERKKLKEDRAVPLSVHQTQKLIVKTFEEAQQAHSSKHLPDYGDDDVALGLQAVKSKPSTRSLGHKNAVVPTSAVLGTEVEDKPTDEQEVDNELAQLVQQLTSLRSSWPVDDSRIKLFDFQWGICDGKVDAKALESLRSSLEEVREQEKEQAEVFPRYSRASAGLELMHLFTIDLLGLKTKAATIFRNKFNGDFESMQVISWQRKYFAIALTFALNAFFIYYMLLTGVRRGMAWQLKFLTIIGIEMTVEVLVMETVEVMLLQYVVPESVQHDVQHALSVLQSIADNTAAHIRDDIEADNSSEVFDAPSFLFVSKRIAPLRPDLLESKIVSSHHSFYPDLLCRTWPHVKRSLRTGNSKEIAAMDQDNDHGLRNQLYFRQAMERYEQGSFSFAVMLGLAAGAMYCLQILGVLPEQLQSFVVRFFQSAVMSGLTLLWRFALKHTLYFIIVGVVICIVVSFFVLRRVHQSVQESARKAMTSKRQDGVRADEMLPPPAPPVLPLLAQVNAYAPAPGIVVETGEPSAAPAPPMPPGQ